MGRYSFELIDIQADFHAHSVVEILYYPAGNLLIEGKDVAYQKVVLALIASNTVHKVIGTNDTFSIQMLACPLTYILKQIPYKIATQQSGITIYQHPLTLPIAILDMVKPPFPALTSDARIQTCLAYLNEQLPAYPEMMGTLTQLVHLSESRLSHLFKKEMGTSLKKHLLWRRLTTAFYLVVHKNLTMYEAAIQSGFHDQAHLSKAFKQLLGLAPSTVYNSRMLQG